MLALAKLTLAIGAITGLTSTAWHADSQTFSSTGKWTANGDKGRCTLVRDFSSGDDSLNITIEPLPLSDNVDLILKSAGSAGPYTRFISRISFGADERSIERDAEAFDSLDHTQRVLRLRVVRADIDSAAASGRLTVIADGYLNASIAVPQLAAAVRVLNQCEKTIVENVGLSATQVAAISNNPRAPENLFRVSDDYFKAANEGDLEDEAIVRYIIGIDGKALNCSFIHEARDQRLNNGACLYMNVPLKFRAARARDGSAVVGLFFDRNRWHRKPSNKPSKEH